LHTDDISTNGGCVKVFDGRANIAIQKPEANEDGERLLVIVNE
jgi:hypothetical protein